MDALYLSTTEWWELQPGQDLDDLRDQLRAAIENGTSVEVLVLVNIHGSAQADPWEAKLLLNGKQVQAALLTTFPTPLEPVLMPHRIALPGPVVRPDQDPGEALMPH